MLELMPVVMKSCVNLHASDPNTPMYMTCNGLFFSKNVLYVYVPIRKDQAAAIEIHWKSSGV